MKKARLADFGISRRLKQGETTLRTSIAGTRCWKAKETINEEGQHWIQEELDIQWVFNINQLTQKFTQWKF